MRAPDPQLKACLAALYHAALEGRRLGFIGSRSLRNRLSSRGSRQMADVMDAVHNLPWLIENWEKCDQDGLRQNLGSYKRKWGERAGTDLLTVYEQTFCRAEHGCDGRFEVVDARYLAGRGFVVTGEIEAGIVSVGLGILKPRLPDGLEPAVLAVEGVRRDGPGQTALVLACQQQDVAAWEGLELPGRTVELSMMPVTDFHSAREPRS